MYITNLEIENVRSFEHANLKFSIPSDENNGINIIIGPNMSGKTSLFQSIIWGLFGPNQPWSDNEYKGPSIKNDLEIQRRSSEVYRWSMQVKYVLGGDEFSSVLKKDSGSLRSYKNDKDVVSFYGDSSTFFENDSNELPLLLYYPVNSYYNVTLDQVKIAPELEDDWLKFNPFTDALSSDKFHKTINLYLRYSRMAINEHGQLRSLFNEKKPFNYEYFLKTLENFLDADLTSASYIGTPDRSEWFVEPITRIHGTPVFPSALSDGFVTTFSTLIDLFIRFSKLPFGLKSKATVIMDEVSGFLHPSWQIRFLPLLRELFPNTQFIVSTHSPFIVSSIPNARFFTIGRQGNESFIVDKTEDAQRWTIDQTLLLFGVSGKPPVLNKYEREFEDLFEKETLTDLEKRRIKDISKLLASTDPQFKLLSHLDEITDDIRSLLQKLKE